MKEYCEHYTLDCQAEKMGCEGCGYYKKSADEMLEELGLVKLGSFENDRFIVYQKEELNMSLRFDKQEKSVALEGFNALRIKDIDIIQMKMEELGWK